MKKTLYVSIGFLWFANLAFGQLAPSADENQQEETFHQIYKNFNSKPTDPESWESAVQKQKARVYRISKGDTLWDLSKTLFGDGFFWSKLWSLNPILTNPHRVTVGSEIQFFAGEGMTAPQMGITGGSEAAEPTGPLAVAPIPKEELLPASQLHPLSIDDAGITIPKPGRNYTPVLDALPSGFLAHSKDRNASYLTQVEVDRPKLPPALMEIPYFISESEVSYVGRVHEMEREAETASLGDILFIKGSDDFKPNGVYTVVREVGRLKDPDRKLSPQMIQVQGEIKILGATGDFYRAKVVKNLMPIELGGKLIKGSMPVMNLEETGPEGTASALILGSEADAKRQLMSIQSMVFLNQGSEEGVKLGQRYHVYAQHRIRHMGTKVKEYSYRIAQLKIVHTQSRYSTGVILNSNEEVRTGDSIGQSLHHTHDPKDFLGEDRMVRSVRDLTNDLDRETPASKSESMDLMGDDLSTPQTKSQAPSQDLSSGGSMSDLDATPANPKLDSSAGGLIDEKSNESSLDKEFNQLESPIQK